MKHFAVQFTVLIMGLSVSVISSAVTLSEIAPIGVKENVPGAPDYSDVLLSGRYYRSTLNKTGLYYKGDADFPDEAGGENSEATIEQLRNYPVTRFEWNYHYADNGLIGALQNCEGPFSFLIRPGPVPCKMKYVGAINIATPDGRYGTADEKNCASYDKNCLNRYTRKIGRDSDVGSGGFKFYDYNTGRGHNGDNYATGFNPELPNGFRPATITWLGQMIGDVSDAGFRNVFWNHIDKLQRQGTTVVQIDDAALQYGWVMALNGVDTRAGFGYASRVEFVKWLRKKGYTEGGFEYLGISGADDAQKISQLASVGVVSDGFKTAAYAPLRKEFEAFHLEQHRNFISNILHAFPSVQYSCNSGSFQHFAAPFDYCDLYNVELSAYQPVGAKTYSTAEPEYIWARVNKLRGLESNGKKKAVIYSSPQYLNLNYNSDTDRAIIRENTRKLIALTYSLGSWMIVPWDQSILGLDNSVTRYYGKFSEYGDLYHFIRENEGIYDGYQPLYEVSSETSRGGSPLSFAMSEVAPLPADTENGRIGVYFKHPGIPAAETPLVFANTAGKVIAAVRGHKQADLNKPIAVHLVNFSPNENNGRFYVDLKNSHFGYQDNVPVKAQMIRPYRRSTALEKHVPGAGYTVTENYPGTDGNFKTELVGGGYTRIWVQYVSEYGVLKIAKPAPPLPK